MAVSDRVRELLEKYSVDEIKRLMPDGGVLYDPKGVMWAPANAQAGSVFVVPDADTLALRQRYAESAFDDRARSDAGALGAYQIMPDTLQEYVDTTGRKGWLSKKTRRCWKRYAR